MTAAAGGEAPYIGRTSYAAPPCRNRSDMRRVVVARIQRLLCGCDELLALRTWRISADVRSLALIAFTQGRRRDWSTATAR